MKLKAALFASLIFISLAWPFLFGLGITSALLSYQPPEVDEDSLNYDYHWGDEDSLNKIVSISLEGIILDSKPDGWGSFEPLLETGVVYGSDIKERLMELAEDESVSGLILEINSPGGTVTGSNAIADGIRYYQSATAKPVYVFASGIMASGSYWAGVTGDYIMADTGSLIGSIGVIGAQFATYNDVVSMQDSIFGLGITTRDGIEMTVVTSGEGKDFGNPFRAPTPKELELAQRSTDQAYEVFVEHVANRRRLESDFIRDEIGAYVYGEQDALSNQLIDEISNRENVYVKIASRLGYGQDFQIVKETSSLGFWASLLQAKLVTPTHKQVSVCHHSKLVLAYYGSPADLCGLR